MAESSVLQNLIPCVLTFVALRDRPGPYILDYLLYNITYIIRMYIYTYIRVYNLFLLPIAWWAHKNYTDA